MKSKYIIFDLDDTLAYEIDYLKSAYKAIAHLLDENNSEILFQKMLELYQSKFDVFEYLSLQFTNFSKGQLLDYYRNHQPHFELTEGAGELLQYCKKKGYKLGLITDGRSITQRNKITALGIEHLFDRIVISEEFGSTKPDINNFQVFIEKDIDDYYYVADNIKKDFVTPNALGWKTICLKDRGHNIHKQTIEVQENYKPQIWVDSLKDILID